ncbi:RNA polymerase sigma factor FliA [Bermanella marisrubri]|uniref:RNA polymerase sigma factor FliA n=1 Tax=Bermanella marisrubri TaxID=207949 RepID=Q1N2U5_9GAMM|nr:RNA polymerase sigma factor FliA [Bermanella marisrubri]EAT12574.1 flagellar biosynthesis sigma factor [Oceanobacter sp. RED65] [Bermanella marisrubri]QIZ84870.1 RNA polymerase sigma factor FliA [Bermanella marisrubri]
MNSGAAMYLGDEKQNFNTLVEEYASLVKRIAHHLKGRLPDSVQVDDLIQSGMIGLIEAAQKYEPSKGASFETYAGIRIRGSMLDEIRKGDWAPRSVHRNSRRISEAIRYVESQTGRDAQDQEVAKALGMELEEYHQHLQDGAGSRLFSFEDLLEQRGEQESDFMGHDDESPLQDLQSEHFQQQLAKAISQLPEREQLVLALYYDEELNLKEIGAVLEVSESRVSQIHSQAAHRLRARLQEWAEGQ